MSPATGVEWTDVFFERDGKVMGNVRHYNGDRERFHWSMSACDLCAAEERLDNARQEFNLVERRFWGEAAP